MARTEGKREAPRERLSAKPAPKRPTLPTVDDAKGQNSGLGKRVMYVAIGLLALAGLVSLGVGLANQEDPADTLPAVNVDVVSGSPLAPFAAGSADPAIGVPAPEIESVDFAGNPSGITNDGTPKLIVFLAHWCPHCQREVPVVQAWIEDNGVPDGVEFISVATAIDAARPNYPPNAWLDREGWTQRVVMDDGANTIGGVFGLTSFPYYVMIDGSGAVVRRLAGEQDPEAVGVFLEALALTGSSEG